MKLSERAGRIGESATMRVTRRAEELQAQGVEIISFGAGEPDFESPGAALEGAHRALDEGYTRYTPAAGALDLREALLERYHREYAVPWTDPSQVVVTVGAKAALFELALALFSNGDEVIIPSPCWVSFPQQAVFAGAQPIDVPASWQDGFRVRAESVIEAFSPRTRAVILNSPSNPTGAIVAPSDLRAIVEAAADRGVVVVSDETYERFVYSDAGFASSAPLAREFPDTVVLVGSFSKTYAMTGWRIGYVLGPAELLKSVIAIQSHATSNPTSFAMRGALAAMAGAEEDVRAMIEEFRVRRDLVVAALDAIPGVQCPVPAGAFYAFPRVADLYREGQASSDFCELLLDEAQVAVVPGIAFGNDDHIRLSFSSSRADLEAGIARIAAAVA
ncbi:MAG: pyridoxal phosphate-dependent aminotransferase [Acidobacteriota bacterium]|nr:pyridoxal phosphate-dependent aminotransferase [Acidobacteriota bacterium]